MYSVFNTVCSAWCTQVALYLCVQDCVRVMGVVFLCETVDGCARMCVCEVCKGGV